MNQSKAGFAQMAVVIPCYNRLNPLKRLLFTLEKADFGSTRVPLVFVLDYSGSQEIASFIGSYQWPYGEKRMVAHTQHYGLRKNILFCGDLSEEYGAVIVLEDDLIVSPGFYQFAVQAVDFYGPDDLVAGISLYSYEYAEIEKERFHPCHDGNDTYFMQWPSSSGQIWTSSQWHAFRNWYDGNGFRDADYSLIPPCVRQWPETSWKKYFTIYLTATRRYFVYPRVALSSNYGDAGTNGSSGILPAVQVPLFCGAKKTWLMADSGASFCYYDVYFQPERRLVDYLYPTFREYDYDVDLQATKPLNSLSKPYLLSVRECNAPIQSFDWNVFPFELNLFFDCGGDRIHFGLRSQFSERIPFHFYSHLVMWSKRLVPPKRSLKIMLSRLLDKIRR